MSPLAGREKNVFEKLSNRVSWMGQFLHPNWFFDGFWLKLHFQYLAGRPDYKDMLKAIRGNNDPDM